MSNPMQGIDLCELVTQMSKAIKACNAAEKEKRISDNLTAYHALNDTLCILQDVGVVVVIEERWECGFVRVRVTLENLQM